ncbi:MAG: SCO family protein [Caldilineaceae bacterium]|nr:SCO family protein [Caldilineaceae bacterium]
MMKHFTISILLLLSLLLGACSKPHQFSGTVFDETGQAFDFTGTNYDGSAFQLSDHRGEVVLLFFGYTFCPDICPLTLTDLSTLYEQLGEQANNLTVVFVTVDPERDTLETMASYVPAFNSEFYGVRVEGEMYEAMKKAYGLYVEKRAIEGADADTYFVDHTGIIYLIDKEGNLSEVFPVDSKADFMQADVEYWLKQQG